MGNGDGVKRDSVIGLGIGVFIALPYIVFGSLTMPFLENVALRLSGIPLGLGVWWLFFRKKPPQP